MLILDTIAPYFEDKQRKKPLAANTRKQYGHALRSLAQWIGPDADTTDLTETRMQAYFDYLLDEKHFTRTLHLQWIVITGWARWLLKAKHVPAPFLPDVELPAWKSPKQTYINDKEAAALVLAATTIEEEYKRLMVTALMTLLCTTGLRHDEITDLRVADVSVEDYWIEVNHGKGDKYRRFKMSDQCVEALRAYLAVRPADCTHDFLFARSRVWRVGYGGLWTLLEEVKGLAGLSHAGYIKPHRLRHAAASRQHHNGASLETMKTILGHSSILTTAIYLHTDDAQLEAVRNFSALPLGAPPISPVPAIPQKASLPKYNTKALHRPKRLAPLRLVRHNESA